MILTVLLIFPLAVWRISSLLVHEQGPFRVFVWLRERAGIGHDADWNPREVPDGFFAQLLGCVWCLSLWVGLFFTVLFSLAPAWSVWCAAPFAFSAGAILFETLIKNTR